MDEFLRQFPKIDLPSASEIIGPNQIGAQVYSIVATQVSEEDYLLCLEHLRANGFSEIASHRRIDTRVFCVSTYRKGSLFIAFRFAADKKIWITFYEDQSYHAWTGAELFAAIPAFEHCEGQHCGNGCYEVCIEDAKKEDYESYLEILQKADFSTYIVREEGLANAVFSATYTKGELILTVTHIAKTQKMYLVVGKSMPLSKHLHDDECRLMNVDRDKKTTLAMLEMTRLGCSFVVQLKNGHFIINDGGYGCELEELLAYMERLAPNREKPIVEAWFVSHAHPDHSGVITRIAEEPEYANRIQVEGIYCCEPSENMIALDVGDARYQFFAIKAAANILGTEIYRPQTGQRYYFCDITIDILHTPEQMTIKECTRDFNDSCIWCLYTVEDQTVLLAGDADKGSMKVFTETYEKGRWHFDVFAAFHHGSNTNDMITNHCSFQTILVPRTKEPEKHPEENRHLKECSKEWFLKGEGTRVLTFPYKVGTSELSI